MNEMNYNMMKKTWIIAIAVLGTFACKKQGNISITEIEHQNLPHFKVETPNATYMINKESGGAASIIDKDGIDWIKHSKSYEGKTTNGADSEWRGLPNLVHRDPDNGVGHPAGTGLCKTVQKSNNQLYTTSNSGLWEFSWTFEEDHTIISVEKNDTSRNYWFLYEGPVAGNFSPSTHYWGNDVDGVSFKQPNLRKEPYNGTWQWAYFGDQSVDRSFYVSMVENDTLTDFFAYMGNLHREGLESSDGMTVFGFGRSRKVQPLMSEKNRFVFGFYEIKLDNEDGYNEFSGFIKKLNSKYK